MRRTIPAILALSLALGASAVLAEDEEAATVEGATQRADSPAGGLALEFPAEWRVMYPDGERVSVITNADDEPVMETTVVLANGEGGTWCDVDAYLRVEGPLEEHAFAYVNYLQQIESSDVAMVVAKTEIPAGSTYRIEAFDQSTGGIRAMYLFDGPAAEDGTFSRYLLSCSAREVGEPFWEAIAESVEVSEPVTDEMTEEDTAESEG